MGKRNRLQRYNKVSVWIKYEAQVLGVKQPELNIALLKCKS